MTNQNSLKVKTKIKCFTCQCTLARVKTIKVLAVFKEDAKKEADSKIKIWLKGLKNDNCRICKSILKDYANDLVLAAQKERQCSSK